MARADVELRSRKPAKATEAKAVEAIELCTVRRVI